MTDRETALSILTRVAAELVRHDGLPDPEEDFYRMVSRSEMRRIVRDMSLRGQMIAKAIEMLRNDAK